MEILLELPPVGRKLVENVVLKSSGVFNGYFIPCTPAGIPVVDCFTTGVYVLSKLSPDSRVYVSLRTRDYSLNHVVERAKTAYEFGFTGILVTRGDPPKYGGDCKDYSTEQIIGFLRELGVRIPLGVVLSLKYSLESISNRVLSAKPDFAVALRFSKNSLDMLREVRKVTAYTGTRLHVFLLLGTGRNIPLFEKLGQPYIGEEELGGVLAELERLVDAVVVSSPNELYRAVEIIGRKT